MSISTRQLLFSLSVVMIMSSTMYAQTNPPECETLGFCPRTISTVTDLAPSIFATDLDGDGDNDVLVAEASNDMIIWYENTDGLGTFGPQQIITNLAEFATSVFAADLDGDGDTDVLSASRNDNKIAWYENIDGLGTFGPQLIITTEADSAGSVFAADLDHDGDIDVLSASLLDNKIAWYENIDGLGTFGPQLIITTEADSASSVFAADLDNDGDNDVLSASLLDNKIAWYENTDGLGTFGPQQIITNLAEFATSVFAADLDGDGDTDVLSASNVDDKIAWYENIDGLGTFGPQLIITTNADSANSVFAADLDNDGDIDVLSSSFSDDKIAWYENTDGLGTFGPQQIITNSAEGALFVFAVDLDSDGDTDVLSASWRDNKIAWYENGCDCNNNGFHDLCDLAQQTGFDCNLNSFLDECDLKDGTSMDCDRNFVPDECDPDCNNNGIPDQCDIDDGTSVDCNGNHVPDNCDIFPEFTISTIENNVQYDFVIAADLDNDFDQDIIVSQRTEDKVVWYENIDGVGTFGSPRIISTPFTDPYWLVAADLDGDHDTDIIVSSLDEKIIVWYENSDGLGNFNTQHAITTEEANRIIFSIMATDLDSDGDLDILSMRDSRIVWYENIDGLGTFGSRQLIDDDIVTFTVFAADLDGDGDNDILSAGFEAVWLENTDGMGNFGPPQIIDHVLISPISIKAADLDGDTDLDVFLSDEDGAFGWYENTDGQGTFVQTFGQPFLTSMFIFASDLDGDSDLDIHGDTVWFMNEDGLGTFGQFIRITTNFHSSSSSFPSDLDRDGDIDIVSVGRGNLGPELVWFENTRLPDCNLNNIPDECDIFDGIFIDCNNNMRSDECEITDGTNFDCNLNSIPDDCDIVDGTSLDCNNNTIPDECEECCENSDCEDGDQCNACQNGICVMKNECGACCNSSPGNGGICINNTLISDCQGEFMTIILDTRCENSDLICEEVTGACCDRFDGFCQDDVIHEDCTGIQPAWTLGESCQSIICDPATGACCNKRFGSCTDLIFIECQGEHLSWTKGEDCSAQNCPDPLIPTVSQWGLVIMSLLILIAAKLYFGIRRTSDSLR